MMEFAVKPPFLKTTGIKPQRNIKKGGCTVKITFFSNFLNHHQLPLCLELMKIEGVDFKFVACIPIVEEKLKLGYEDMNQKEFVQDK